MQTYLSHASASSASAPDVPLTVLKTEIKVFWKADLAKTSREREEAAALATEAEKGIERWGAKLSDGEKKLVEEAVGRVRETLSVEGVGLREVRESVGELRKVHFSFPFVSPLYCG